MLKLTCHSQNGKEQQSQYKNTAKHSQQVLE